MFPYQVSSLATNSDSLGGRLPRSMGADIDNPHAQNGGRAATSVHEPGENDPTISKDVSERLDALHGEMEQEIADSSSLETNTQYGFSSSNASQALSPATSASTTSERAGERGLESSGSNVAEFMSRIAVVPDCRDGDVQLHCTKCDRTFRTPGLLRYVNLPHQDIKLY
jgi:hypothetical protein